MGFFGRLLGRGPASMAIAEATDAAEVRVSGKVACATPLVAPYTGRSCAYWRIEAHDGSSGAVGVADQATDFAIVDASGRAEMIASVCVFDVVSMFVEMERSSSLSQKAHALPMRFGWGPFAQIAQITIREAIVAIDETIDIEGRGERDRDGQFRFTKYARVRCRERDARFLPPDSYRARRT